MRVEVFCLCDNAYLDSDNKLNIKGIFDRMYAQELPFKRTFFVALRMRFKREEVRNYKFKIEIKKTGAKDPIVHVTGEIQLQEPKNGARGVTANEPFKLPITFSEEGEYSSSLFIEGEEIKSIPFILVKKKEEMLTSSYSEGHRNIITMIQSLRDRLNDHVQSLKEAHPEWSINTDSRITIFNRLMNNVTSVQLALIFSGKHLSHDYWWNETVKEKLEDHAKNLHIDQYNMFFKIGFIQLYFSNIEAGMRSILKSIDPKACKEGRGNFKNIYDSLLSKKRLSKSYDSFINALDLFRLIRNTIHNNGFFFPSNGKDKEITYKGDTYKFIFGEQVNFVDWNFILFLLKELADYLHELMTDPKVVGIKDITDPWS